ncbi:hypothetical protein GGR51DRAFT_416576 [Nemania sp. FL0031]|nr:hypothetical protein GGR51DRAFT_416576 [Nemania sp. FL0031]
MSWLLPCYLPVALFCHGATSYPGSSSRDSMLLARQVDQRKARPTRTLTKTGSCNDRAKVSSGSLADKSVIACALACCARLFRLEPGRMDRESFVEKYAR